ncbi:MAG TPA: LuxR C-terminal-related transcriptional regulator [Rhizorhapis sp.]|nr:LuxR C-terminal-related transcriptional regulator [Rhizorhapis sp.]
MEQFLRDATIATSAAGLWDAFVRHIEADRIFFAAYTQFAAGSVAPSQTWGLLPNFPENWLERYEGGLWETDPVRSLAAFLPAPFRWWDIEKIRKLSPEEKAYKAEIEDNGGPLDGLIVPVFGYGNRNGYVVVGLPDGEVDLSPSQVVEYRIVCQYLHQRYCELVPPEESSPVALSKREMEVLRWVARGKSNSVIAEILGVSANTVDTHLRRIYHKLNVCDRVSAALAGISKGMIALD